METGITTPIDNFDEVLSAIEDLTKKDVLIGVPSDNDEREEGPFGNAAIGYLNENGSPAQNIPARPHLGVGVEKSSDKTSSILAKAAENAMSGEIDAAERGLIAAGQVASDSVKNEIRSGLSPALDDSTLKARARRGRKGAQRELASRKAGNEPSSGLAKPLYDTSEYIKSITHVVRERE